MAQPFKPEMTEIFFSEVAPAIDFEEIHSVLDHGCGTTGVMSSWFIRQLSRSGTVYFTDIQPSSIETTTTVLEKITAEAEKTIILQPVLVRNTQDILDRIPARSLDLLVSNLAQFPLPQPDADGYFVGRDGREMITPTFETLIPHCLQPGGAAYLSWTELSDLSRTLKRAEESGCQADIAAFGEFPLYEKTWKPEYMEYLDQLDCPKDKMIDQFRTARTGDRTTFTTEQRPYMLGGWLKVTPQ